jgi:hypothetical protein
MISRFNSNPHSAAYECSDGVFVLYADYEALEAKLALLVKAAMPALHHNLFKDEHYDEYCNLEAAIDEARGK